MNDAPRRKFSPVLLIAACVIAAFLLYDYFHPVLKSGSQARSEPAITTPSGLQYVDVKVGTGPSPRAGQTVTVHYVGTLDDGTKFDSSRDRNEPLAFPIGEGKVIRGWDEGVMTMRVGGRRKLTIPAELGYGDSGTPDGKIPANATLHFDVELLGIR